MRVIIVGGGKTSYHLARKFISKGYHVCVITADAENAAQLARRLAATVVVGNGSDPALLEEVGARRTTIFVALTLEDHDNLIACQLAKEMFGVPRTVALVQDPESVPVFEKLGVSVAISLAQLLSLVIEEQVGYEDVINLAALEGGQLTITEIVLHEGAPAVGHYLHSLSLPENALIAAVIRQGEVIVPGGGTQMQSLDRVLVITQPHNHAAALHVLVGESY